MKENLKTIRSEADYLAFTEWIKSPTTLAWDIETTGLNVRHNKLIGMSISDGIDSYYLVHKEWSGTELQTVLHRDYIVHTLYTLQNKKLLTFNGSFDSRLVYHEFDINLIDSIYCDVMLLAHTCNENFLSYKLKTLAANIFGEESKNEQNDLLESLKSRNATMNEFYKAESSIIAKYGAQDALLTYKLYEHFSKLLTKDGLDTFFYMDEIMPLYKEVTIPMELHGIPVDTDYLQRTQKEITLDIELLEDKIQLAISPLLPHFHSWYIGAKYPFKLTGRFKQKLGEKIAHPAWPKTEDGKISLNKNDLVRAQNLTKTEIKKGLTRELLPLNTDFELIAVEDANGNTRKRCPVDLVHQIQLELMAEDGIKYPFQLSSKDHLKRLFFGTTTTPSVLKEKALSFTDKGNPQVNDEFIDSMKSKYEWCKDLHVYNKLNKIKSSYVDSYLEEQENGIFYPSFFQHRTVSGRYGSDIQQLSRPMEEGQEDLLVLKYNNRIREFFIAPKDYIIVDNDYESLEPHTFAHVSKDPGLCNIFNNGHDFYSTIAIKTERLNQYSSDKFADNYLGKLNKNVRQKAKVYALGIPYGMTPYALAMTLNVDEFTARQLWSGYLNGFPELAKWMEESKTKVIKEGKIRTETGRIRRFPELQHLLMKYGKEIMDPLETWKKFNSTPSKYAEAKEAHKTVKNSLNNARNIQIQGLSASIVNRASILFARKVKELKLKARIIASIHDELVVLCEESIKEQICTLLQYCMENAYPLSIKLKAVPSTGRNWREAKK